MSVHQFRSELKEAVDEVLSEHEPLRVTRRNGEDFVVLGADDWAREQETLYVLQNPSLMEQIGRSLETHRLGTGYSPQPEELDALDRV
jgi:antitoxin YefM